MIAPSFRLQMETFFPAGSLRIGHDRTDNIFPPAAARGVARFRKIDARGADPRLARFRSAESANHDPNTDRRSISDRFSFKRRSRVSESKPHL